MGDVRARVKANLGAQSVTDAVGCRKGIFQEGAVLTNLPWTTLLTNRPSPSASSDRHLDPLGNHMAGGGTPRFEFNTSFYADRAHLHRNRRRVRECLKNSVPGADSALPGAMLGENQRVPT